MKPFMLLAAGTCWLAQQGMAAAPIEDASERANWFGDPFFQVRAAVLDCPEPLGPRLSKQQATLQEHYRAERGTSCFLAGACSRPNAYLYDAPIASAVQQQFDAEPELAHDSSLWITVTRRFVYVEGCQVTAEDMQRLTAMIRTVPDVQQVLVNVAPDVHGPLPYKRWSTAPK